MSQEYSSSGQNVGEAMETLTTNLSILCMCLSNTLKTGKLSDTTGNALREVVSSANVLIDSEKTGGHASSETFMQKFIKSLKPVGFAMIFKDDEVPTCSKIISEILYFISKDLFWRIFTLYPGLSNELYPLVKETGELLTGLNKNTPAEMGVLNGFILSLDPERDHN